MDKSDGCCSTHLIDGDRNFNVAGLDMFIKEVKLAECGLSYAVVSIMGPQSSGKSTLLNHLFSTNFREMDAFKGRSQTTKGIWLAQCIGIEPCTLVMDLEGTDGRERGEDDTAFEKQSALFSLAVSDIMLINMWCHDIGREQAANKPLLKTVFQAPASKTLITPVQCKSLWRQFKAETEYTVTQAISAQEASGQSNNWLPPPWAIVELVVLGFNEFMTLLRNPLYLGIIFVAFLLVKALWVQLNISGEFRNGALPGILSLSTKFLPTVMKLLRKLAEEGQKHANTYSQHNAPQDAKSLQSVASSSASSEVTSSENGTEYSSPSARHKLQ